MERGRVRQVERGDRWIGEIGGEVQQVEGVRQPHPGPGRGEKVERVRQVDSWRGETD